MTYHTNHNALRAAAPHAGPKPAWPPNSPVAYASLPHSGFGVAAFVLSLVMAAATVLTLVLAFAMTLQARRQGGKISFEDPLLDGMLCAGVLSGLLALVGVPLSLASLNRKDRRRLFGLIALVLNVVMLLALALGYLASEPVEVYRTAPYGLVVPR